MGTQQATATYYERGGACNHHRLNGNLQAQKLEQDAFAQSARARTVATRARREGHKKSAFRQFCSYELSRRFISENTRERERESHTRRGRRNEIRHGRVYPGTTGPLRSPG